MKFPELRALRIAATALWVVVSGSSFAVDPTGFAKPVRTVAPAPLAYFDWFEYSGHDKASTTSTWRDDFNSGNLQPQWLMVRTATQPWAELASRPGWLTIHALRTPLESPHNKSFLGRRQQDPAFEASVGLETPDGPGLAMGLVVYQNEKDWYFLGVHRRLTAAPEPRALPLELFAEKRSDKQTATLVRRDIKLTEHLKLKIAVDSHVAFYFDDDDSGWKPLKEDDHAAPTAGGADGIAGALVGPYARAD